MFDKSRSRGNKPSSLMIRRALWIATINFSIFAILRKLPGWYIFPRVQTLLAEPDSFST